MREELQRLSDEFIRNRDVAKEAFAWDSSYMIPICAEILLDKKQPVSVEILKSHKQMIKDRTGFFSNFRGEGMASMACMLVVSEQPEQLLSRALTVYEGLKKHFWSSSYLPLVSMIVADLAEETEYSGILQRTKAIYDLMKKAHPFLTSEEDGPFAALLAFSENTPEGITAEAEKCYQLLKSKFYTGNALQSLSHVLALGEGSAESKCRKMEQLFDALKAKGYKYGTDYELPTLGALSILPMSVAEMVEDLIAVADYLSGQKGYGFFGFGKHQRLMHAAMLVAGAYEGSANNTVMTTVAVNGTLAQIAAQQAAMCAAIAATAAASSASN